MRHRQYRTERGLQRFRKPVCAIPNGCAQNSTGDNVGGIMHAKVHAGIPGITGEEYGRSNNIPLRIAQRQIGGKCCRA